MASTETAHYTPKQADVEIITKAFNRLRSEGVDEKTASTRIVDRWQSAGNTVESLTKIQ